MDVRVSLATALLMGILACSGVPRRPANVPAEAFWAGKKRDGVFVLVTSKDVMGWRLKIYDRAGNLKREGLYTIRGMARAELLPEEVVSFDGEALHLNDGALLVPRR